MNTALAFDKQKKSWQLRWTAWQHREFFISFFGALSLFMMSLIVNFYAGTYATLHASAAVRDIILDNVSAKDVDGIFVYGIIAFFIGTAVLLCYRPKAIPFVLNSLGLFILIRSFFIILTHIGPSPSMIEIPLNSIINNFTFTGDLFFSAHTGMPFLLALIFWKNFLLRLIYIGTSILFGVVVLLGHFHYSIDVFAAFFITYGIYHIALQLFKKESRLLYQDEKYLSD